MAVGLQRCGCTAGAGVSALIGNTTHLSSSEDTLRLRAYKGGTSNDDKIKKKVFCTIVQSFKEIAPQHYSAIEEQCGKKKKNHTCTILEDR